MRCRDEGCGVHPKHPHTAHYPQTATIHYPWHPLYKQDVEVRRSRTHGECIDLYCRNTDGSWSYTPAWMTDQGFCSTLRLVNRPWCDISALRALQSLMHQRFTVELSATDIVHKHVNRKGGACGQSSCSDRTSRTGLGRAKRGLGSSGSRNARANHRSAQPTTCTVVRSRKQAGKRRKEAC